MLTITQATSPVRPAYSVGNTASRTATHTAALPRSATDDALIDAVAGGDRRAMEVLYARHHVRVYRFVLRMTGNETLAEDIVSEVFLDVWRRADTFKAQSLVSTWLLAIARHKSLSAVRRRSDEQLDDDCAAEIEDLADNAEVLIHNKDRSVVIRKCLSQLSAAHREVVDLVYYHEKSVEEVARIVGAPASTVKTRMFYARQRLAELLKSAGVEAC